MKLVGLITEYNPFHNGHAYHLQKALQLTQADAAVVVMSGDFV
ncbi:MAG TPA: nucleotidyltransferase, partial [Lachnospiraceae bacterium]|nr:nucleotidyltransferase [Lachnospiraceae bacterium]